MADNDIQKSRSRLISSIKPSDSIQVKVVFEATLLGQPTDLGCEYTPLPDGNALWKLDWEWDLENETLNDVVEKIFPHLHGLPGVGGIKPGMIDVEYFSGGGLKGLLFGIGDLSFMYVTGPEPATCWGLVHEKPIDIKAAGLLAHLIGPRLTLQDLCLGNISDPFDGSLRDRIKGQFPQAGLLLGEKEPIPKGFVGCITIMGMPIALPFSMDDAEKKTEVPVTTAAGKPAETATGKDKTQGAGEPPGAMRKWFQINKTIGPLHLGRVGCQWRDSRIGLLLDSDVEFGGLHLGLSGLSVSLPPFDLKPEKIKLDIDGIDISYRGGPLSISGAFLKTGDEETQIVQYDGMARIKTADFTITGMGSYAVVENHPSLFIFAILHKTLGGPTFFLVNGLAAGFGYNRTLKLPPIEEVHNFPLVRAALDENYLQGNAIHDAMLKLHQYIQPSQGDYWFAVGIRFSSFEMVLSFAMLSVSFGHEVVIALLGLSKMTIPKDAGPGKAIAYAELALRAVIRPEEGTIMVEGRLTSESYIFSRDCHLTGGFAFYVWCSGEHAGDFVITLGGYHPRFLPPPHYPAVPRLGVNWQVTKELTITSELYFAMTSSCIMAGGKLAAVYQSGSIRAWFIAYADFLLNWQPLYYMADLGISIGVEARLRIPLGLFTISFSISLHLSVQLHIQGPEFAGVIEIDLTVITLTIRFGAQKALPEPLTAEEFVYAFLPSKPVDGKSCPAPEQIITTRINSGLIREDREKDLRVVTAHGLALTIQSLIPVTAFTGLNPQDPPESFGDLGIRSMGKTSLESSFSATIIGVGNDKKNMRISTVKSKVPDALWGKSAEEGKVLLPARPEANPLTARVGLRISFAPIEPEGALPPMEIEKFKYEEMKQKLIPWDDTLQSTDPLAADEQKNKIDTVMDGDTIESRNKVLAVLVAQEWPFVLNQVDLTEMKKAGDSYFQAGPEYRRLGEALK